MKTETNSRKHRLRGRREPVRAAPSLVPTTMSSRPVKAEVKKRRRCPSWPVRAQAQGDRQGR